MKKIELSRKELAVDSPFVRIWKKWFRTGSVEFPHPYFEFGFPDFCNVIPVTRDGNVVMIRQFRAGVEEFILEIPGGLVDKTDASPEETALRELEEETGYVLAPGGSVFRLGWVHPNPAVQGNRCHFFAVGPVELTSAPNLEPAEHIEVELVACDQVDSKIRSGEISHALVLNAFHLLLQNESASKALLSHQLETLRGTF